MAVGNMERKGKMTFRKTIQGLPFNAIWKFILKPNAISHRTVIPSVKPTTHA